MKRTFIALVLAAPISAGCSSKSNIWLIEVDTSKGNGLQCKDDRSTNYSGTIASSSGGQGSVTETQESTGSKILFYAKLVDLPSDEASLNSGSLLLPGKEKDRNKLSFQWTESEVDARTLSHEDGYYLEVSTTSTATTAITLDLDGKTATGNMTVSYGSGQDIKEDDLWSENAASEIGSSGELGWNSTDGWESNRWDTSDCDGDDCTSTYSSSCSASAPLTAVRTDLSKSEDFGSLVVLEQYGSFKTSSTYTWGGSDSGWSSDDSGW